jgi:hypothetical protein
MGCNVKRTRLFLHYHQKNNLVKEDLPLFLLKFASQTPSGYSFPAPQPMYWWSVQVPNHLPKAAGLMYPAALFS